MRSFILIISLLWFSCSSSSVKEQDDIEHKSHQDFINVEGNTDPCPPEWVATGKTLEQKFNDSTEQLFLDGTLWFEIISPTENDGVSFAYIKEYRTNKMLQAEGIAVYHEHPIVDYVRHDEWIIYDCFGEIEGIVTYNNGVEISKTAE
ncbi:hypothetical protein RCC89_00450 [Cytophagaceae bacterium ABcell3]|nr:hypothetical protein RCC89_00450 [Cytophagaceae bacterium ABcell3]